MEVEMCMDSIKCSEKQNKTKLKGVKNKAARTPARFPRAL